MSESDQYALREMRREIWLGGFRGGAVGFVGGVLGYKLVERSRWIKSQLGFELLPKHKFATPLFSFAFGMMLGSMTSARNNSHTLQYIIRKHSKPQVITDYQHLVHEAKLEAQAAEEAQQVDSSTKSVVSARVSEWDEVIKSELEI